MQALNSLPANAFERNRATIVSTPLDDTLYHFKRLITMQRTIIRYTFRAYFGCYYLFRYTAYAILIIT